MQWKYSTAVIVFVLLFFTGTGIAKEQSASVNASVPAGKIHTTRLRNLPEAAFISATVETDGRVKILLVDEENVSRAAGARKPLFSGETADKISIGVSIPKSGNYYLLVDNQGGTSERHFSLSMTASAEVTNDAGSDSNKITRIENELEKFEQNLRRYFVFDNINFRIARCGTANAFSSDNTVIICEEIGPKLREGMGDDAKAQDALLFAMMHELGHVLLQQWGYPFHANEEVADEFATALLVLFNQGDRARAQAEFLSKIPPEKEFALKRDRDDRHPLSVQRARNILGWLDDPNLLKRWQKIFVPHLQTNVLRAMTRNPKPWIDQELVARELSLRSDKE